MTRAKLTICQRGSYCSHLLLQRLTCPGPARWGGEALSCRHESTWLLSQSSLILAAYQKPPPHLGRGSRASVATFSPESWSAGLLPVPSQGRALVLGLCSWLHFLFKLDRSPSIQCCHPLGWEYVPTPSSCCHCSHPVTPGSSSSMKLRSGDTICTVELW